MRDEEGKHNLRITQRLRLDPPKLDDVQKRIASSSSHAIFMGLAGSTNDTNCDDASVQTRPLRNLVSYLKQKEAAGVISLLNKETEATGVLYAFPLRLFHRAAKAHLSQSDGGGPEGGSPGDCGGARRNGLSWSGWRRWGWEDKL